MAIPSPVADGASSPARPSRVLAANVLDHLASSRTAASRVAPWVSTDGLVLPTATQARSAAALYAVGVAVVSTGRPAVAPSVWSQARNVNRESPWNRRLGRKRTRVCASADRTRALPVGMFVG